MVVALIVAELVVVGVVAELAVAVVEVHAVENENVLVVGVAALVVVTDAVVADEVADEAVDEGVDEVALDVAGADMTFSFVVANNHNSSAEAFFENFYDPYVTEVEKQTDHEIYKMVQKEAKVKWPY